MLLLFTYYFSILFFTFLLGSPPCIAARTTPRFMLEPVTVITVKSYDSKWHSIEKFLDARKGSSISGISELKKYFNRFGYVQLQDSNITDIFDAQFESAVMRYQGKLGLQITGKLDFDTLSQIVAPRCGVPEHALHATKNYVYFPGKPRWARPMPITLTYSFSPENVIKYLSLSDIRDVFKRAFARWATVIPVSFTETDDYGFADIKIGFYSGDHGDEEPFDGVLGVLAHAFSPESGKFHLDEAETWAIDFQSEKSPVAVDLESVATHEIGHLLGLGHSSVKEAVMYPSLKPRGKKVDLMVDDIEGVQALYGSNPNFTVGSLLESDISTNQAVDLRIRSFSWAFLTMLIVILSLCM